MKRFEDSQNATKNFGKLFQSCNISVYCYFIALLQIAVNWEWCSIVICMLTRSTQKVRAVFATHTATF